MNINTRIRKISQALEKQIAGGAKAFLTLEQWERRYNGEDIPAEIPENRRAEFDECERKADERVRQAEEIYFKHNPELPENL